MGSLNLKLNAVSELESCTGEHVRKISAKQSYPKSEKKVESA